MQISFFIWKAGSGNFKKSSKTFYFRKQLLLVWLVVSLFNPKPLRFFLGTDRTIVVTHTNASTLNSSTRHSLAFERWRQIVVDKCQATRASVKLITVEKVLGVVGFLVLLRALDSWAYVKRNKA